MDITGIILAGGKSSRFGRPKYLAKIGEKSLLEITIGRLKPFCQKIIVVSKSTLNSQISALSSVRNVLEDGDFFHPLVGIKTGLKASNTDANLVLACDMPFVTKEKISGLIPSVLTGDGVDVRLYRYENRLEPLFGFYRKNCLSVLTSHLTPHASHTNLRIIDILDKCRHEYIKITGDCLDFFNINTKKDLDEAQRIARDNPTIFDN